MAIFPAVFAATVLGAVAAGKVESDDTRAMRAGTLQASLDGVADGPD
jgi:hypothetical protein